VSVAEQIERTDRAVAEKAAPVRETLPVTVLGGLSEIADQPELISLCAATVILGLLRRDRKLARTGAEMLAAELLATKCKSFVKHRVDRTRPRVVADGGDYVLQPGSSSDSDDCSFPSGHTAGAVAVARAIAREYPEHGVAAYASAAAVALIQIPRCQHYPSDLAAGALIGLGADAAVALLGSALSRH